MNEPRVHERHDLQLTVDLDGGKMSSASHSVNISAGGISVQGDYELGDQVKVSFAVPASGLFVHTHGKVVWTEEGLAGLAFDDLDPALESAIAEVLKRQTQRSVEADDLLSDPSIK
jgi:hypothetical protein